MSACVELGHSAEKLGPPEGLLFTLAHNCSISLMLIEKSAAHKQCQAERAAQLHTLGGLQS